MDTIVIPSVEQLVEKGKVTASSAVKTTVSDVATAVSDQVGIKNEANSPVQSQNTNQGEPQQVTSEEDQRTKEMVRDFYSPSEDTVQNNGQTQNQKEEQDLATVRQKLHQERHNEVYFDAINNAGVSHHQEERPAEKVEREEKQEMQELQQKEMQKPPPLAVKRAQTAVEANRGIAG